jgi:hypothetical protein
MGERTIVDSEPAMPPIPNASPLALEESHQQSERLRRCRTVQFQGVPPTLSM